MATYYVRQDGNDSNTGLGSTTLLAWRTVQKALGATGMGSGDTVYIAPGTYVEQITVAGTYSATTSIIGDTTASQFIGINAGPVRLTPYPSSGILAATFSGPVLSATSKNFLSFDSIIFQFQHGTTTNGVQFLTCQNITLTSCVFETFAYVGQNLGCSLRFTAPTSLPANMTIQRCIFGPQASFHIYATGSSVTDATIISDCLFLGSQPDSITHVNLQISVFNSTFVRIHGAAIFQSGGTATNFQTIRNCVFYLCATGVYSTSTSTSSDNFNRYIGCSANATNTTLGGSTSVVGVAGIDYGQEYLVGLNPQAYFGNFSTSPNLGTGTPTGAPSVDMFEKAWSTGQRDIGAVTYSALSGVGNYLPTERNASAITIAPASTSQSIELYLGATGLTFSTTGLAAYYVRNQSAPVSITLVTQTPTGAWSSGGFAEIDSSLVPGVYRLDVPNAAFSAGASDVTIVVRGASGTNGAVLTVTLSSGGLTAAQTAAAVWDEARASHTTAGTFGQYVNAELVTPVTSAALVRMGPFEVRADGLGASDPLDIQKGAQHGVDIQCVDNNGSGIDITSATVTAKVYNSGATLVDTYACTATYAADGRATFTIDTTVTNVPGTYTATITRTTGANDTQVFGPLRIYVRDI